MERTLYEKLKDIPVGKQIEIEEGSKISVEKSEDLKEDFDLMKSESAFHVYGRDNEVVGSLTIWNDGTIGFFSHIRERDFRVDYASDLVRYVLS